MYIYYVVYVYRLIILYSDESDVIIIMTFHRYGDDIEHGQKATAHSLAQISQAAENVRELTQAMYSTHEGQVHEEEGSAPILSLPSTDKTEVLNSTVTPQPSPVVIGRVRSSSASPFLSPTRSVLSITPPAERTLESLLIASRISHSPTHRPSKPRLKRIPRHQVAPTTATDKTTTTTTAADNTQSTSSLKPLRSVVAVVKRRNTSTGTGTVVPTTS